MILLIFIFVFCVIGLMRGWRREIVSLAFVFAAVLVLVLNGGAGIADVIFVRIPWAVNEHRPPDASAVQISIVTTVTVVLLILLGYLIGNRGFPKPATPADRIFGGILGIVAGYILYNLFTRVFSNFSSTTGFLTTSTQNLVSNSSLLIVVLIIVLLIAGLVASSMKKGGAKGK